MYRNRKLLDAIHDFACAHCGVSDGTVSAAHSNQLRDGKGRGLKAHDYRVAALCNRCHYSIDQGRDLSYEQRIELWEEAHRKTVGWLFEREIVRV
jgi:hypothetical protein